MSALRHLAQLEPGHADLVIGVIVEKRPVRQTKGEDCVLFLGITDNSMESEQFVTVNLFRPSARDLPNIESEGDIVILRNLRIQRHNGKMQCVSQRGRTELALVRGQYAQSDTQWVPDLYFADKGALAAQALTDIRPDDFQRLRQCFRERYLKENTVTTSRYGYGVGGGSHHNEARVPSKPAGKNEAKPMRRSGRPMLRSSGIEIGRFFDYCGRVLSVSLEERCAQLILTDGTTNAFFNPDFSDRLIITAWSDHRIQCQDLAPGDLIRIENLRPRTGRSGFLEAALHFNPDDGRKIFRLSPGSHDHTELANFIDAQQQKVSAPVKKVEKAVDQVLLEDIDTLENLPTIVRAHVQIVDCFPKEVAQFTRRVENDSNIRRPKYQYMFGLMMEDETGCLPLMIHDGDMQAIMPNAPNACDLKRNDIFVTSILDQLKHCIGAQWTVTFKVFESKGRRFGKYVSHSKTTARA